MVVQIPSRSGGCSVVVGAQWGNEGKGKLVHELCKTTDVCARFNGGANNVHTVSVDSSGKIFIGRPAGSKSDCKTILLRLFPLGVVNKKCKVVFGNGMVIHLPTLLSEIESIQSSFDPHVMDRIYISSRAHIVFDFHQVVDTMFEELRENRLGTSQKGIGPAYSTKTIRNGLRMGDLFSSDSVIKEKITELVTYFTRFTLSEAITGSVIDPDRILSEHLRMFAKIQHRVVDTVALLDQFHKDKLSIVCEGSNSVMSDLDFGTYPYVTSSNTTPGSASIGLGIPPTRISKVLGVCKSYTSRPQHWFPSILAESDPAASQLIARGHEFGTSGGKPRRVGWIDLVQVKYAAEISGFDSLFITKLDALTGLSQIGIVTSYSNFTVSETGFPSTIEEFSAIKPVTEYVPGWTESLQNVTRISELPENAKSFLKYIETFVGVPVEFVQIGAPQTVLTDRDIIRK